jgi:hypothetical protein
MGSALEAVDWSANNTASTKARLKLRLFLRFDFDGNALVSRSLDHAQPDDHRQIK